VNQAYAKTPEARKFLTMKFHNDLDRMLLHAGTTTKRILDVYMLVIHVFAQIDSRGVLLDNVARPIRRYLKTRTDSSKIIISSMLADANDSTIENSADISKAIAQEMLRPINLGSDAQRQDRELDFDNMQYMPQPNDASSDFKRNESNDAISHLLSLYDKEQFLGVLKNILGEHLLKVGEETDLERETRLLELFKSRFGDDKMQACDVMLQDISNSRRLNKTIAKLPEFQAATRLQGEEAIGLTTQVLSSYFWPELRDDEFKLPTPIEELQAQYAKGFEAQHNMMRLQWLPALGRATVELEFKDRKVMESVPPWVASVIYAFEESPDGSVTAGKTVAQVCEQLSMEEALVKNALSFWASKRVLAETSPETYSVIESLSAHGSFAPAPAPAAQEEVSAVKTSQDIFEENAETFRKFVYNMLMNRGMMPLPAIAMTMKMVLPDIPFKESDLKGLMQAMVDEGKLVSSGGMYSVKKP
jgi:anaphase-promoting complex subunit 2